MTRWRHGRIVRALLCSAGLFVLSGCSVTESSGLATGNDLEVALSVERLLEQANARLIKSDIQSLSEARVFVSAAYDLAPTDSRVFDGLGVISLKLGDFEDAQRLLNQAISLNQENPSPYVHLGLIEAILGRDEVAESNYRKALQLDPLNVEARNNLSVLLVNRWSRGAPQRDLISAADSIAKARLNGGVQPDVIHNNARVIERLLNQE